LVMLSLCIISLMYLKWRKIAASFVLLWALMDLSVPGVCQADDLEASPANAQMLASPQPHVAITILSSSSVPDQNPSNQSAPEDCFCCCSHIAPTPTFEIAAQVSSEICEPLAALGQQLDYSLFIYHPPRT
jgi:hypothetical protein